MQNEQEKIVTTPSESADSSGFEIVKTEPLSEQEALQGYSWTAQIKIDPTLTPDHIKQAILDGALEPTAEGTLLSVPVFKTVYDEDKAAEVFAQADAVMKEISLDSKITDIHGDSGVIVSNGRVEGELVLTPVSSMRAPSKGGVVQILASENPEHTAEIEAMDNSAAILDPSRTIAGVLNSQNRAEIIHSLSDGPAGTARRIDQAEAILGSFKATEKHKRAEAILNAPFNPNLSYTGQMGEDGVLVINPKQQAQMNIRAPEGQVIEIDVSEVAKYGNGGVLINLDTASDTAVINTTLPDGTKKTTYIKGNESMTEFETPENKEAKQAWDEAQNAKDEMMAAATPLDDSEYQARKEQHVQAAGNEVQKYTRARGSEALVVNKFVLDGTSYPGDVVVGWAERHTPIRWCDPKDVDTNQIGYLPCKPALKTANPIPGIVAIRRKNGQLVILCGYIADLRIPFKAHVFNENQLTKGKLAESLQLAKLWDNSGIQKAAADAASIVAMQGGTTPGKSTGKMVFIKDMSATVDAVKQSGRAHEMTRYHMDPVVDLGKA